MIQARYGWTDAEILALPYSRFAQLARVVMEAKAREVRLADRRAAFIGWQIAGALGASSSFGEYLEALGLAGDPIEADVEMSPEEIQAEKERAFENARRALEAFQRKGGE
ncbi:hypothetical protein [Meiothermus granaticius]|uniref:Uncharacterized protein n=1 Tax=Meiothermus granaticius NBRC 107808 TaxID=1227551 RepID=A0A399FDT4_9DEIN|nr:hypothetical protein [Meiothermus granaticius]RIH93986.1 hypothetical protein Mgrana_00072 [Meiothermus granaticius NBRC 107808]GEM88185.1 hypothetical protein MGR01S_28100 [Meiothermus granaticius NBRC 107808]